MEKGGCQNLILPRLGYEGGLSDKAATVFRPAVVAYVLRNLLSGQGGLLSRFRLVQWNETPPGIDQTFSTVVFTVIPRRES